MSVDARSDPGAGTHVEALAFDWGGVFTVGTFDGRAVEALANLLARTQDEVAQVYYPLMERFEVGEFDLSGFQQRLTAGLRASVDADAFREAFLGAPLECRAMYELVAHLPETYAVAMLSNNVPELCDRVRSDPRLTRIEAFVFSNEIGVRKPDAHAFAALSEALGSPPETTVFIDDNARNVEACQDLGFQGMLLDTPAGFAERWRTLLPNLAALVSGPAWD